MAALLRPLVILLLADVECYELELKESCINLYLSLLVCCDFSLTIRQHTPWRRHPNIITHVYHTTSEHVLKAS